MDAVTYGIGILLLMAQLYAPLTPLALTNQLGSESALRLLESQKGKLEITDEISFDLRAEIDSEYRLAPQGVRDDIFNAYSAAHSLKTHEPEGLSLIFQGISRDYLLQAQISEYVDYFTGLREHLKRAQLSSHRMLLGDAMEIERLGGNIGEYAGPASDVYLELHDIVYISGNSRDLVAGEGINCQHSLGLREELICASLAMNQSGARNNVMGIVGSFNSFASYYERQNLFRQIYALHVKSTESIESMFSAYNSLKSELEKAMGNRAPTAEDEKLSLITGELEGRISRLNVKVGRQSAPGCPASTEGAIAETAQKYREISQGTRDVEKNIKDTDAAYLARRILFLQEQRKLIEDNAICDGIIANNSARLEEALEARYSQQLGAMLAEGLIETSLYAEAGKFTGAKTRGERIAAYVEGIEYLEMLSEGGLFKALDAKKERVLRIINSMKAFGADVSDEERRYENAIKADAAMAREIYASFEAIEADLRLKAIPYLSYLEQMRLQANDYIASLEVLGGLSIGASPDALAEAKRSFSEAASMEEILYLRPIFDAYSAIKADSRKEIETITPELVAISAERLLLAADKCGKQNATLRASFTNPLRVHVGPLSVTLQGMRFDLPQLGAGEKYVQYSNVTIDNPCVPEAIPYGAGLAQTEDIQAFVFNDMGLMEIYGRINDLCYFTDCSGLKEMYGAEEAKLFSGGGVDSGKLSEAVKKAEDKALRELQQLGLEAASEAFSKYERAVFPENVSAEHAAFYAEYRAYAESVMDSNSLEELLSKHPPAETSKMAYGAQAFGKEAERIVGGLRKEAAERIREASAVMRARPDDGLLFGRITESERLFNEGRYAMSISALGDIRELEITTSSISPEFFAVPMLIAGTAFVILRRPKKQENQRMLRMLRSID